MNFQKTIGLLHGSIQAIVPIKISCRPISSLDQALIFSLEFKRISNVAFWRNVVGL